jgi:hypothetical protein
MFPSGVVRDFQDRLWRDWFGHVARLDETLKRTTVALKARPDRVEAVASLSVAQFRQRGRINDETWKTIADPLIWVPSPLLRFIGLAKWTALFGRASWDASHGTRRRGIGFAVRQASSLSPAEWLSRLRQGVLPSSRLASFAHPFI